VNIRSLKFRLVVWYAGWLTFLFVVFGLFVYASLEYHLKRSLREALARRTRQVADLVQRSPLNWVALGREIQSHFAPESNNRFTRVIVDGVVTYVAGAPADLSFVPATVPLPLVSGEGETFERRELPDGSALLIVVLSRATKERRFVIEEGSSEARIQSTLHAWVAGLVLGLTFLILLAVLGGYVLVKRALEPVTRIIESAEGITSRNLNERLPIPRTQDELEQLSVALNRMIHRLDEAFQHTQRFLADASHELRTPLTIIQAELEALERMGSGPDVQEPARSALDEVARLRTIVEGLFALSRLDAGEALEQTAPFDLAELAATTTDQMCLLAVDKKIAITCDASAKVVVEGDRARLKQVIVNLLDNAIKFTAPGGQIHVRVSLREQRAILEVTDNGMGMPPEAIPHVFERFFRVDKARSRDLGGAGLGLSIVKSICLAHRGRVEVESKEGHGSRFIVELPLASQP
jgi:heavy metal sensor kinase